MLSNAIAQLRGWHADRPQHDTSQGQGQSRNSLLAWVGILARTPRDTTQGFSNNLHDSTELDIETRKKILCHRLRIATTQAEWHYTAAELDDLEGNNDWKFEFECKEYDPALVQSRLSEFEDARISCDPRQMLFLIRTALTRHVGGMGNIRLYRHSHVGTKILIERYRDCVLDTIKTFLDTTKQQQGGLDPRHLLEQVLATRQSFGRSALLLSGGGTFGMNHIGVVKCLWENNLLPRVITGASAGSIVGAVLCTKKDTEMDSLLEDFCHGDLNVFTSKDDSLLKQLTRFMKTGALFDVGNLTRIMRNLMGDITFLEAYNRTRRILNICVSSASVFELPRLLNHITAPNVIIWSAVAASCSVPGVFTPASLLAKDAKTGIATPWNQSPQRWVDGSIEGDIPTTRISEMFNVNHFIVSQVNPHVVPFLVEEQGPLSAQLRYSDSVVEAGPGWLHGISNLAKNEAIHRMHVLSELGVLPNVFTKISSLLSQRYSGDITILPQIPYSQFPNVLKNPTTDYMLNAMLYGERATWPQLDRIRNHCAIELALDAAIHELRARIAFPTGDASSRLQSRAMSGELTQSRSLARSALRLSTVHLGSRETVDQKSGSAVGQGPGRRAFSASSSPSASKKRKSPFTRTLATDSASNHVAPSSDDWSSPDSAVSSDESDIEAVPRVETLFPGSSRVFQHGSQPPTPNQRMPRLGYSAGSPLAYRNMPAVAWSPMSTSPSHTRSTVGQLLEDESELASSCMADGSPARPCKISRTISSSAVLSGVGEQQFTRSNRSMSTGLRNLMPPNAR